MLSGGRLCPLNSHSLDHYLIRWMRLWIWSLHKIYSPKNRPTKHPLLPKTTPLPLFLLPTLTTCQLLWTNSRCLPPGPYHLCLCAKLIQHHTAWDAVHLLLLLHRKVWLRHWWKHRDKYNLHDATRVLFQCSWYGLALLCIEITQQQRFLGFGFGKAF